MDPCAIFYVRMYLWLYGSIIYGSMTTSIQEASGGDRMRGVGLHMERRRSFQDRKLASFLLLLLPLLLLLFLFCFLYIPTYPPSPANTIPLPHFTCPPLPLSALPRISKDRKKRTTASSIALEQTFTPDLNLHKPPNRSHGSKQWSHL